MTRSTRPLPAAGAGAAAADAGPASARCSCRLRPARGAEAGADELRVAFMDGVFSGLNRTDALASIKAWIESVAALRGYHKQGVITVYADLDALRAAVAGGQVHMAALQSDEWLRLKGSCALMPVFIPTIGATLYDQILLLVRRDAGLDDLADLRGATVAAHNTAGRGLGELWLDHELRVHALPERDRFFRAIETVEKSSAAVLAVFFGKAPACLVSRKAFDIAAELNPQLAQQLRPLLVSPDIVGSVICVWSGDWPHKQDLLAALAELHSRCRGARSWPCSARTAWRPTIRSPSRASKR